MVMDLLCSCWNGRASSSSSFNSSSSPRTSSSSNPAQQCTLDNHWKGDEVIFSNGALTIAGYGTALAVAPLVQGKSYFEATIDTPGLMSVGVASRSADLSQPMGCDEFSWSLSTDLFLLHNRNTEQILSDINFEVGDVIGVSYDHSLLAFYYNGQKLEQGYYTVRGRVFPSVSVQQGASCTLNFGRKPFKYPPPADMGFQGVLFESSLI